MEPTSFAAEDVDKGTSDVAERPAGRRDWDDRAARLLGWPITAVLLLICLGRIGIWLPDYLTWPYWTDHDVFATMAMAWDQGVLPYRDMVGNNFPGSIYLFWILGKIAGWGNTIAFYAFDAGLLLLLGVTLVFWSAKRFGRWLPGVVAFSAFSAYYISVDYSQAGQRDWMTGCLAVISVILLESFTAPLACVVAGVLLATGFSIRPQIVLFAPAVILTLALMSRERSQRFAPRFALLTGGFLGAGLLLIAPLLVQGIFDDFRNGIRVALDPSNGYNQLSVFQFVKVASRQITPLLLILVVGLPLLQSRDRGLANSARIWLAMTFCAFFYMPLSPVPHEYLAFPLILMQAVLTGLAVGLVSAMPGKSALVASPRVQLAAVLALIGTSEPRLAVLTLSPPVHAIQYLRYGTWEELQPRGYRRHPKIYTTAYYNWEDYRAVLRYAREELPPDVRVANLLKATPALTGSASHLSALPAESLAWLIMVRPQDEERFAEALRTADNAVVVWSPMEFSQQRRSENPDMPKCAQIGAVVRKCFEPSRRFGDLELWVRKPTSSVAPSLTNKKQESVPGS